MTVLVITTGGTIGALPMTDFTNIVAPGSIVTMPPNGEDFVKEALAEKFDFRGRYIPLEGRDSKFIDEPYRFNMLQLIEDAPENKIIITQGTDTLLQTADYFYRPAETNPMLADKIILLTGSMVPLSNGPESDGYLNLKFALEQLKGLTPNRGAQEKTNIYIVLCDYELPETENGAWAPRLYPYYPGHYQKMFTANGRYNRIRRVNVND